MNRKNKFPRISEDEYLKHVIDCIPSAIILFKILTGLGATSLEIEYALRNSILIEPNLPVIRGKCAKYNTKSVKKVMGVYEGVTVDQIIDYLESSVTPKKIITTPESYFKVKQAFIELKINIYEHSFMLFDECERAIQDVNYRSKILLPMKDFFKFNNKAFISATPIVPSDPNFASQNFKHIYIKPNFNIKKDLKLINTNNVQFSLEKFIKENPREQYFIFFKSTDKIAELVIALNIKTESAVFCAKESKNKLKVNEFKHVYTNLAPFKKYNFFTSRFFSAVDIESITNPTIIIISDVVSVQHSMVDPKSESIQIIGRFRKVDGKEPKKEVIHIANFDIDMQSKSVEQCQSDFKDGFNMYRTLKRLMVASTSVYAREALREALTLIDFAKYVNEDGSKNYFMQDNTIYEEMVKGYYQSIENLLKAYEGSKQFNVIVENEVYNFTDSDKLKANNSVRLKTVFEVIMPVIKQLYESKSQNGFMWQLQIDMIKQEFPEIFKAFDKIGFDEVKKLEFDHKKVKKAIQDKELANQKTHFGLLHFIGKNFIVGRGYTGTQIVNILKTGLADNNLKLLNPSLNLLRDYCKLSDRKTLYRSGGKEIKGYYILEIYHKLK